LSPWRRAARSAFLALNLLYESFNPPKGILFIVTLPFRLQTGKNAQLFAFFGPQMSSGRPQMAEKGLILRFRACPYAPKTGGMLGISPSPYPHRCRLGALYPPPVGVRRAENPRIAGSALTPRHARISARNPGNRGERCVCLLKFGIVPPGPTPQSPPAPPPRPPLRRRSPPSSVRIRRRGSRTARGPPGAG